MANQEQLEILLHDVEKWNNWRTTHLDQDIDLSGANLKGAELKGADLGMTNLRRASLEGTYLNGANLNGANLARADLTWANLKAANLCGADLGGANLTGTYLNEADLSGALLYYTNFTYLDLSSVNGLESVHHVAPSNIGIETLYKSKAKIPREFLLGCGIPEQFITFIPSLTDSTQAFQHQSLFISYSTKDEEFAKRLHSRLRDAKVRVWFAPEDIQGGKKLYDQLEQAIQLHDRLLLVLSEHSIKSNWVETEIRRAIETEKQEGRRKLFPILLTDYPTLKGWKCFDADSGRDMAIEIREYFIPDFSNWKDHDSFEKGFEKLLRDLKSEDTER